MAVQLVVARPFADYKVGDVIADPTDVATVLASPNHVYVRKVGTPDATFRVGS